ncbi:hypothetical protein E3N88_27008 [Mikania micrantha]|uniref:Uncharacterized protein n=1 Tax=Mikania micrantha TaxID=192012 RepID=A0A5N6MWH4_9ASTR|nr:hypothetical protein E3N88_27008 [Mikania micrantha]
MGNYMETCIQKEKRPQAEQKVEGEKEGNYGMESCRMRVKLVLTKDELEWLLLQMKNKSQGKRLEEVLGEIEKSRMSGKSVAGWKPSLENTIVSCIFSHYGNAFYTPL